MDNNLTEEKIELTEDVLTSYGFKVINYDIPSALSDWNGFKVEYILGYKLFRIWDFTNWQIEMTNLYQLKNLYFALFGKEIKTIK